MPAHTAWRAVHHYGTRYAELPMPSNFLIKFLPMDKIFRLLRALSPVTFSILFDEMAKCSHLASWASDRQRQFICNPGFCIRRVFIQDTISKQHCRQMV